MYIQSKSIHLPLSFVFGSIYDVHVDRSRYMTDPTLRAGLLKGTFLTMYQVQGTDNYFGNWSQTREIGSAMPSGVDRSATMRYSTTDMYQLRVKCI